MKNLKFLAVIGLVLIIGAVLAGCKSMQLNYLETDTVQGPKQVRQGQDIDPKSITVWGIYKDGSRKVVPVGRSEINFNRSTPGPQTVKIRVGILTSQEVSFQTEVMALRSLTVASQPKTTIFKAGSEPEKNWPGLEVRGEWDQMGSDKIDLALCEITGYMKDQAGKQTITVVFEGLQTTFDVDVRSMSGMDITQNPTKLDYLQGEPLNLAGLKVVGSWGDGIPSEELRITAADVTGFNPNNAGVQRLTITKNEKIIASAFNVEVLALSSIVLDKPPTKDTYKVGEALDLTGIEVTGNYTGSDPGKRRSVLIAVDQLDTSGFDSMRIGRQQRVTVMVKGRPVSISANFFVHIEQ
jgi:hypothetical protein